MRSRLLVAAAVLGLTLWSAAPLAALPKPGCPTHKPLIVDATLGAANVDDYGEAGQVWALDTFVERIRVWQVGTNQFCAELHDVGTFVSFAGVSPGGTGTIEAGVTGTFEGTRYISVAGVLSPDAPTSGHIGDFDAGCNQQGVCANRDYRFVNHLFSRVNTVRFGWFSATYDAGDNGTFVQSTDGNDGDITS
jgi:hypothetical protein